MLTCICRVLYLEACFAVGIPFAWLCDWKFPNAEISLFRCLACPILASHEPRKVLLNLVKRPLDLLQYGNLGDCCWYGKLTPNDCKDIAYVLTDLVVWYGIICVWEVYQ